MLLGVELFVEVRGGDGLGAGQAADAGDLRHLALNLVPFQVFQPPNLGFESLLLGELALLALAPLVAPGGVFSAHGALDTTRVRDDVGAVGLLESEVVVRLELLRLLNLLLGRRPVAAADDVELRLVLLPLLVHDEVPEEGFLFSGAVAGLLGVEVFPVRLLSLVAHTFRVRVRVRVVLAGSLLHPQPARGVRVGVGRFVVAVADAAGVLEGAFEVSLLLDVALLSVILRFHRAVVVVLEGARAALEELVGDHLTQRLLLELLLLRIPLAVVVRAGIVVVGEELRVGAVDGGISPFDLRERPRELLLHLPRDLTLVALARTGAGVIVGPAVADDVLPLELLLQPMRLLPSLVVLEPRGELFVDCERVLGALDVLAAVRAAAAPAVRAAAAPAVGVRAAVAVAVAFEHLLRLRHLGRRQSQWRRACRK